MKANGKGRECPSWCRVDHEAEGYGSCNSQEHRIKAEPSVAGAEASLGTCDEEPKVSAWIHGPRAPGGRVTVQGEYAAERLARALEAAADLTKPQLRQLAVQVRAARAEAWPEQDKEAEAG
jgi:hypothetical protein